MENSFNLEENISSFSKEPSCTVYHIVCGFCTLLEPFVLFSVA